MVTPASEDPAHRDESDSPEIMTPSTTATISHNTSTTSFSTIGPSAIPLVDGDDKVTPTRFRKPAEIECWGHRGASALLPENTLASFRAAILEGAQGIESDVHSTSDGVILMFHDPTLDRTTDGKGLIRTQPWKGVIEHVRTLKTPKEPIPRFDELLELLAEPGNRHVTLNIDCKIQNDPETLFPEMARIIATHDNWETDLAPRLILGIWHPLFLKAACKYLPLLQRYHIGFSTNIVKKSAGCLFSPHQADAFLALRYFWDACHGFSINFALLMGVGGQEFLRQCREAGKEICVWTVNSPEEMKIAMTWGIKAILTDKVAVYNKVRSEVSPAAEQPRSQSSCQAQISSDPEKLKLPGLSYWTFSWSNWRYYSVAHVTIRILAPLWLSAYGALPRPHSSYWKTYPWFDFRLPRPIPTRVLTTLPNRALAGT